MDRTALARLIYDALAAGEHWHGYVGDFEPEDTVLDGHFDLNAVADAVLAYAAQKEAANA